MVEDRREPGFGLKRLKEGRLPAPPIPLGKQEAPELRASGAS
jgi:hypothetical protein